MTSATLVTRLDNAGDVLLAGPAVRAAARGGPVHVLCGPRGRGAADLLPGVDGVLVHRPPGSSPIRWRSARRTPWRWSTRCAPRGRAGGDPGVVAPEPSPLALLLRWAGVAEIAAVSHDHAGPCSTTG